MLGSWGWPVALGLICITAELAGDQGRAMLRFDRALVHDWQLWRLISGHVVHLGASHMLLNLIAFTVLKLLFEGLLRPVQWLSITALSVLGIDVGLLTLSTGVDWYVGLSGVLHGIAAGGALELARDSRLTSFALLAAIVAKLAFEQLYGPMPFSAISSGGPVVVDAHLYGAIGGAVGWAVGVLVRRRFARPV